MSRACVCRERERERVETCKAKLECERKRHHDMQVYSSLHHEKYNNIHIEVETCHMWNQNVKEKNIIMYKCIIHCIASYIGVVAYWNPNCHCSHHKWIIFRNNHSSFI